MSSNDFVNQTNKVMYSKQTIPWTIETTTENTALKQTKFDQTDKNIIVQKFDQTNITNKQQRIRSVKKQFKQTNKPLNGNNIIRQSNTVFTQTILVYIYQRNYF